MSSTLGLDLGTNSIGWSLIEDGKRIVDMGVRIFPVGVKEEDFQKQGREISKNVDRRIARGMRRRRHRYLLRRQLLLDVLGANGMLPSLNDIVDTRSLYELRSKALDEKIRLEDIGRVLLMLNKRRGFKSNRKTVLSEEEKKAEGIVRKGIQELHEKMEQNGSRTVGEYFSTFFLACDEVENWHNDQEPIERIRSRFVDRAMYENEFDLIWKTQQQFYPHILTSPLRNMIRDHIIFYQRPLKSQKGLVGRCRLEPGKRCAPRSTLAFQEYRIWQQLAVIRFANGERIGQFLTPDEKRTCADYLMIHHKLTPAQAKKLLKLPRSYEFNEAFDEKGLLGNTTAARLIDAIGLEKYLSLNDEQAFELWHILSYADDVERIKQIVIRKIHSGYLPKLEDSEVDLLASTVLQEGYGNLSAKALRKILPFLRQGQDVYTATVNAGYSTSVREGTPTREQERIPPLRTNELRNPIVQQILTETFRVVNAIVRSYGKPDLIRVEMARELKKPKKKREEARWRSLEKRKKREEYADFLTSKLSHQIYPNDPEVKKYELWLEMGCENDELNRIDTFMKEGKIRDHIKYKLWKECGRISPYTGKVISLKKLFSPEIEIEHIWPYSKTMNSEFSNLCLCEVHVNREKGDTLPYLYFSNKGDQALDKFKSRISAFHGIKRDRFLAKEIPSDFLSSQLNNTSYAAREAAARLETLLPPLQREDGTQHHRVQIVNGQATSILRRLWGLNPILSNEKNPVKNRGDHRHHAIDALVIACTTPKIMKLLADLSKFDELGRLRNEHVGEPWPGFRLSAGDAIMKIIVSLRNEKRVLSVRKNKSRTQSEISGTKGIHIQQSTALRGPLHEETLYGSIQQDGETVYVTRKMLSTFTNGKQLDKIVDSKVREILLERVKKFDGDVKRAFSNLDTDPVFMYSMKNVRIPIRHVRVINPGQHLVLLRAKTKTWVETGDNYAIAIYEDPMTGQRSFKTITFWEAVRKALAGVSPISSALSNVPLLFSLKKKDIVVRYHGHREEIQWSNIEDLRSRLYRVRKFDVKGIIYLDNLYASVIEEEDRNQLFYTATPATLKVVPATIDILGKVKSHL